MTSLSLSTTDTPAASGASKGASLELAGLTKVFPGTVEAAVNDVNLHLEPGEFLTFLGPSGSGKTTTLNLIGGFLSPTSGSILLNGRPIEKLPPHRRDFGMVFQNYALFPHMTVAQNIAFPLRQRRVARAERDRRVGEVMELVGLAGMGQRLPAQLSGGQQQRVALARAVVFSPHLLLLDEPLGALDRKLRQSLQAEIKRIHREVGLSFLFVTHDQEEAMSLSDRIAVFNHGRIERIGSPVDLYDNPGTEFVAQFVGESNLFRGTRLASSYEWLGGTWRVVADAPVGDLLVVRPERIALAAGGDVPAGMNSAEARVIDVSYLGTGQRVDVEYRDGSRGVAILPTAAPAGTVGEELVAWWRPEAQTFVARAAV